MEDDKKLKNYKVVLLGDSGVGKTSIVCRYIKNTFDNQLLSTAGVCFFSKNIVLPEIKQSCKLDVIIFILIILNIQIWDTAGQERYKAITKIYYQKSDAIIFIYDITSIESFEALKKTYNEVKQTIDIAKINIFIVGNKNDLYLNQQVKKELALEYAKSINAHHRIVSALNDEGIKELFEAVAESFFQNDEKQTKVSEDSNNKEFVLIPETKQLKLKNKRKGCC